MRDSIGMMLDGLQVQNGDAASFPFRFVPTLQVGGLRYAASGEPSVHAPCPVAFTASGSDMLLDGRGPHLLIVTFFPDLPFFLGDDDEAVPEATAADLFEPDPHLLTGEFSRILQDEILDDALAGLEVGKQTIDRRSPC